MYKVNLVIASTITVLLGVPFTVFSYLSLVAPGKGSEIGALLTGLPFVVVALLLLYLILKLRWRLCLFEKGFVFARGKNRVVPWEEVRYIYDRQDVVAGLN